MPRLALFVVMLSTAGAAQMPPGFDHFYNLEYPQAMAEFRKEIAQDPKNPDAHNHLVQTVLYQEMFQAGALESELVSGSNPFLRRERVKASAEAAKQFDESIAAAMSLSQERLKRNEKDTGAMYALGVAHGLRANYNFLVRKSWTDALKDATAARKLHNKVVEIEADFIDARLVQGVHDYVVGSLPWHWKMLGFVAGFRGDREAGMKTLKLVAEKGRMNRYDAQVLLAAIYRRERRPKDALPLLETLTKRFPRNYLFRLEMVQMHSDAGNKDAALAVLAEVEKLKRASAPGYATLPLEKVFFYRGNLLFWYREWDAAIEQLRRVTPNASALDLHTSVMAWLRLGQTLDVRGRRNEALEAYREAIRVAPQSEAAKESRQYVNAPYRRT